MKVHCRVHNILPLVPVMSQLNPVHNFPRCLFKICFPIIPIYVLVSEVVSFPQFLRPEFCLHVLSISCVLHALPISLIWLQIKKLSAVGTGYSYVA